LSPGDDVLLADLLGQPAQRREPVLERAGRDALGLPALKQRLDVLGLQALGAQVPVAQLVELVGDEREHPLAVGLGGVAAVPIPTAELLQLVVQISHDGLLGDVGFGLGLVGPKVVVGEGRPVSVSVRPAGRSRARTSRDTGHRPRVCRTANCA
jgi:hypothetical protein